MNLVYLNTNGKEVKVTISEHAIRRFIQRYNRLNSTPIGSLGVESKIESLFRHAQRFKLNSLFIKRKKKYGKDTLYFKCNNYTFVIQNSVIVTIEINGELRYLNTLKSVV